MMSMGAVVHRLAACSSTNDVARDLAVKGGAEGTAVWADAQSAGRGTKGRSWFSPAGLGLYASYILRPAGLNLNLIPLAVGLGARDAAAAFAGDSVRLKWPNDIVWERRKLGGILCEAESRNTRPGFVIAGVGLNVSQEASAFPEDLRHPAVSLRIAAGREVDREALFIRLCQTLDGWYNILRRGEVQRILQSFEERMAFSRGDRILVSADSKLLSGTFAGLQDSGGLSLEAEGRRITVHSAEVRFPEPA